MLGVGVRERPPVIIYRTGGDVGRRWNVGVRGLEPLFGDTEGLNERGAVVLGIYIP